MSETRYRTIYVRRDGSLVVGWNDFSKTTLADDAIKHSRAIVDCGSLIYEKGYEDGWVGLHIPERRP